MFPLESKAIADGRIRGVVRAEFCPSPATEDVKNSRNESAINAGARRWREVGVRLCIPMERRPGFGV